ncbi:hypothetical protein ACKWTF_005131 [Chironomus riparius]
MMKIVLIIFITFIVFVEKSHLRRYDEYSQQQHDSVKIGGLFDDDLDTQIAFRYAVKKTGELSMNFDTYRKLNAVNREVTSGDEFEASVKVCEMIMNGALGIIGPSSQESSVHIQNICDAKEIPLIETRIDGSSKNFINLHPTPIDLGRAYLDIINEWNWQGFTILYEDSPWLPLVDYIMINYKKRFPIFVRQLHVTADGNYRMRLNQVKRFDAENIVICSSTDKLPEILKQAQQVGLLSEGRNVLITSLDMHTIDLEPYQYAGSTIVGFRLLNIDDPDFIATTKEIYEYAERNPKLLKPKEQQQSTSSFYRDDPNQVDLVPEGLTTEKMLVSTALTYDAAILFSHAMSKFSEIQAHKKIDCKNPESTFIYGNSIFNTMKTLNFKGLSGEIHFDQHGNREHFQLDVLELYSDGLKKVGIWNSSESVGLQINYESNKEVINDANIFRGKVLKILTVVENPPYAMRKETSEPLSGNDQYEGFGIELIEKLAARIGFNYSFELQEDRGYGNPIDENKLQWNGMIGELMADRADLAITDLTVTSDRETAADFTMPFMDLGIQILFQKPKKEDPDLFSFLQPFSAGVWACVIGSFFLVSISLFIMGRMSQQEWDNPYPCVEEPEVLLNQFTLKNAIWFSVGAVLQQGSEIAPKAPSTRLVASIWWFFTLIMVSSYTANLAAFLTIENPSPIISNVQQLYEKGKQGIVKYGAKKGGSTLSFFRDSENEMYKEMYSYMISDENLMMDSNDAGRDRAKIEKYAFLMESSTIEYIEQRHCEVAQVGDKLDQKGYGIAMKKGSPYRVILDEVILQMQESGELARMKNKWWREKRGGGACVSKTAHCNFKLGDKKF